MPYAEHELGYSEFIALAVYKTITCLCIQCVEFVVHRLNFFFFFI